MTDHITIPRALLEQALNVLNSFELQDGRLWYSKLEPEQIDVTCSVIRAELAKPAGKVEPAAWLYAVPGHKNAASCEQIPLDMCPRGTTEAPLYLRPPPTAWHDAPEVAALKSEIERLRKDAERLDYIEESGNFGVTRYRSGPGGPVLIEAEDGKKDISKSASSLRDAIDSVIKDAK